MGEFVIVGQDPAECFGQSVEYFRAAFASESQTHCKVVGALPEDAEETPEVRMDGEDFKCAGDVGLGKPGSLAG